MCRETGRLSSMKTVGRKWDSHLAGSHSSSEGERRNNDMSSGDVVGVWPGMLDVSVSWRNHKTILSPHPALFYSTVSAVSLLHNTFTF